MTSLSPTGGWMTSYTACFARKVIMTSQANTPKRQRRTAIFFLFSDVYSGKYLFGTHRRKIINIYCLLVTEKSANPRVKLTCPCLGKPRHGLSLFDTRVSWFLSHHQTIDVDSMSLSLVVFTYLGKQVKTASLEWTPCDVINHTMTWRHD